MKKTMIAFAVLGALAGTVHAQSNVTLYGLVDVYMGESTTKTQAGTTIKNGTSIESGGLNGSRWGMRGTEDLGGGLKALFQLEAGFNVDDGTPNNPLKSIDRTAKVGLSGGFGTIEFGRQYTRLFNLVDSYDSQGTDSFSSALGAIGGGVMGTSVRWDNSVVYSAPAMGGFSVSAQYAFGENGVPGVSAGKAMGLLAGYTNGPLSVHASYETTNAIGGAPSMKSTGLGGAYNFGLVKAFALLLNQNDGVANGVRENAYVLGLSVPMGAGTFNAGLGNEPQKTAGIKTGKTSSYGIEYRYDLSKRTTVYAALGQAKDTNVLASTFTKDQNYGIGMRHKF